MMRRLGPSRGVTATVTTRRLALALTVSALLAGCGGDKSPNNLTPTPPTPPPANRTIELGGPLDFGDVQVGQSLTRELRVHNRGTDVMTVTSFTGPANGFTASWTSGTIPGGGVQNVTIRFSPTEVRSYSGTLTVAADHTNGSNTIPITARGIAVPRPQFTRTGVGNTAFDMPKDVARLRIIGINNGRFENFIVYVADRLVVNEIIGTAASLGIRYQGDHQVPAACAAATGTTCVVEVRLSPGIQWSFEELR